MSQNKSARGGPAAKGKKSAKPGGDDKREDVLQAVVCIVFMPSLKHFASRISRRGALRDSFKYNMRVDG